MATRIADEYAEIAKRLAEIKAERIPAPPPEPAANSSGVQVYVNWTPNNEDYG